MILNRRNGYKLQIRTDYLSKENTNCLKGIFAVFVLCHHLYQYSGVFRGTYIGTILQLMGYLSVAVFFFLSGYGLMISYYNKGDDYVLTLPRKRILPFYCINIAMIIIYSIETLILGEEISKKVILNSFFWGGTIVKNGWYLQTILLFYISFYIIFKLCNSEEKRILLIGLFNVLYCVGCISLDFAPTWYETTFAFVLGMVWCKYKQEIDILFNKHKILVFYIFILFCGTVLARLLVPIVSVELFMRIMSDVVFVIFVLMVVMLIPIKNKITSFLGKYYNEIYVSQGLFLTLFHSKLIYIDDASLYILLCIASTILFSIFLHPILDRINKFVGRK